MDLGTSGWTEFRMSEDVTAYMADNIELFDCEMGLIHSHHTMGAFFSGQDNSMLQQEGNDTNCFVSLVVDTRGQYVARITRKVQSKSEVTIKNMGASYEFFGEGSREITQDTAVTAKTVTKEVIEYFDLEVERHEVSNSLDYLDSRFEEIERKKAASFKPSCDSSFSSWLSKNKPFSSQEPSLFDNNTKPAPSFTKDDEEKFKMAGSEWTPDPKRIHKAVVHLLTCSLIVNPDRIDLKQWVTRHMVKVYKQLFGEESLQECARETCGAFSEWRDFIIQYILDYFDTADVPDSLLDTGDLFYSRVAQAIYDELFEFAGANPYIDDYMDVLSAYIME